MNRQYRLVALLVLSCCLGWLAPPPASAQSSGSRASSAASYLQRGNEWLARGELDRAIADYDLAIVFDARVAGAYYNRGVARQRKGDLERALRDYDRAIELSPRHADAHLNRGVIRYGQGQYDEAIADCSQAFRLEARRAFAWNCRGTARQVKGELDGAIADFNRAITIDPMQGKVKETESDFARCRALGGTMKPETAALLLGSIPRRFRHCAAGRRGRRLVCTTRAERGASAQGFYDCRDGGGMPDHSGRDCRRQDGRRVAA